MPTIAQNVEKWNEEHDWEKSGDEWSTPWGGADMQWVGAVMPRIHAFVPAPSILEIAPGFGRWTQFLKDLCERLVVVDLSEKCISSCQARFAVCNHIEYHVNDGKSLAMVPDRAFDFVFSFDSLVHADDRVIGSYLDQLAHKLTPNGIGFIHHSNIGNFKAYFDVLRKIPGRRAIAKTGLAESTDHWREYSMTASRFEELASQAGLQCISQETINWRTRRPIDCFSTFTLKGSRWSRENRKYENTDFMREANRISRLGSLYARESFHDGV